MLTLAVKAAQQSQDAQKQDKYEKPETQAKSPGRKQQTETESEQQPAAVKAGSNDGQATAEEGKASAERHEIKTQKKAPDVKQVAQGNQERSTGSQAIQAGKKRVQPELESRESTNGSKEEQATEQEADSKGVRQTGRPRANGSTQNKAAAPSEPAASREPVRTEDNPKVSTAQPKSGTPTKKNAA